MRARGPLSIHIFTACCRVAALFWLGLFSVAAVQALDASETGVRPGTLPKSLYISDFAEFSRSTQRLVDFTGDKVVTHILGCHLEQSRTPYVDYPIGSMYQPDEHSIDLSHAHLLELNHALREMQSHPVQMAMRDFTIFPADEEAWKSLEAIRKTTQEEQLRHMWDQTESR
jgi:hydroxyacylglutathione hydrolase